MVKAGGLGAQLVGYGPRVRCILEIERFDRRQEPRQGLGNKDLQVGSGFGLVSGIVCSTDGVTLTLALSSLCYSPVVC